MNKQFNSQRYVNDFESNAMEEIRISKVLSMIGSGNKVLDIGCGDGFIMKKIRQMKNDVVGIEVSSKAIIRAREKGFKVLDLNLNIDWSRYVNDEFDVVFAGEIIEHIFDTDKFLQNVYSVLKAKGILVLTTPNVASLGRRIFLLLGKNAYFETTARKDDAGHIRYFTRKSLINLLIENGFDMIKVESAVINFRPYLSIYSTFLASLFPSLGNNIIIKAIKRK